jgi:peptidyl-dipeptidase Dcp
VLLRASPRVRRQPRRELDSHGVAMTLMNRRWILALFVGLTPAAVAHADEAAAPASNPLLAAWTGGYGGVPAWELGSPERYKEALTAAMEMRRKEFDAIASNSAAPSFDNTIVAMERSGRVQDRVERMFSVMTDNMSTDAYEALNAEMAPKLAAANDAIIFNAPLFARIKTLYETRDKLSLTPEQSRLLVRTYETFTRAGAGLPADKRERVSAINQELAGLFAEFQKRVLADENTWTVLDSDADLAGLPASVAAAAKAAADERQLAGKWAIVNTRSSVDPFLTFAARRDLREKVWRRFVNRGDNGDANDTNTTIAKIVKLRAERAHLLGFKSHAHWRMQDTMAHDPQKAMDLMMKVWKPAVARVGEEVTDMQKIVDAEGGKFEIAPWDYKYYAEKVRKQRYDLDQSELKPYFELSHMIDAAFWAAGQLYDLQFSEITGKVPVFQPEMRVWRVTDSKSGREIGLFYGDYFARAGKRSGAWETTYRDREKFDGDITPLASNNNNFVKGAPGEPVLISLDDAETLFHEFGHALHDFVSEVNYPSLGETPRDFVEFPSQINEHWVLTREVLDKFARHYQTGAAMPQDLIDKVQRSRKFNQGFATVEYLASAIVDMEMHLRPDGKIDPDAFERTTLARIGMPKQIVMRHRTPQFNHLFTSDAYSAGYYSYLWSEVMDQDTWKLFEQAGAWDKPTADRFRKQLLAVGNSVDLAEAFRAFRGRDPDVSALLEQRGFTPPAPAGGATSTTGARSGN